MSENINTLQQCNKAMKELALVKAELTKLRAKVNPKIAKLAALESDIDTAIKRYGTTEKDKIFADGRTVELEHGKLTLTESKSIEISEITLPKLEKSVLAKSAIRITKSVNKTFLGTLTDKELERLGASREVKDNFNYKLKAVA